MSSRCSSRHSQSQSKNGSYNFNALVWLRSGVFIEVNCMCVFSKERWRLGMFPTHLESGATLRADLPNEPGWRMPLWSQSHRDLWPSTAISEWWEEAFLKGTLTGTETAMVANVLSLNHLETLDPTSLSLLGLATGRLRETGLFRMKFVQGHWSSHWLERIWGGSCLVVK